MNVEAVLFYRINRLSTTRNDVRNECRHTTSFSNAIQQRSLNNKGHGIASFDLKRDGRECHYFLSRVICFWHNPVREKKGIARYGKPRFHHFGMQRA
jgi:hypothetical protein